MRLISILLCLAGGTVLLWPARPVADFDCLDATYIADRQQRVVMLREMADTTFESDADKAAWHLSRSRSIISDAYQPYLSAVAEAIVAGTLIQLADELENP